MRISCPLAALAILALTAVAPARADASGITLGRFGGIYGHTNAEGGLALYWNPARIALNPGYFATLDATLVRRRASYNRVLQPDDEYYSDPGVVETNTGLATTALFGALPYMALGGAWDVGGIRTGFALGAHPAYGGTSSWDKNFDAPSEYPGAVDGTQRWAGISSSFLIIHYTAAGAITLPEWGVSFGAAVSFVDGSIDTVRARNVNRGEQLLDERGYIQEGRIYFSGADRTATIALGASYDSDPVTASVQYRSGYNLHIAGDLRMAYGTQEPQIVGAFLDFPTPHVLQSAVTFRIRGFEATAMADWSAWSRMRSNNTFVVKDPPDLLLEIPRNLNDTFSLRVLLGWNFSERFNTSVMVGWDPSAVPTETIDASLSDADKVQVGGGFRWSPHRNLGFNASYVYDHYAVVEATDSIQEPLANGVYRDARHWLNVTLEGRF